MGKKAAAQIWIWIYICLLIGRLGVGPAIQAVDIVVSDLLPITENLLAVHAKSLMVQAKMLRLQGFWKDTQTHTPLKSHL